MIKEKKKKKIVDKKKELVRELLGYLRTAAISFTVAALFTVLLSIHARNEMIKNLYVNKEEKLKVEQFIAKKIAEHSDYTKSLSESNYIICLQVGKLYETAGDYVKAEYAYYLATQKAPYGLYTPYYKLAITLIHLDKIEEAEKLISSIADASSLKLIKFKTRAYIVLGDKYYSNGKFLKAAYAYEKAEYYYSRLEKQDRIVNESIKKRISTSYLEAADFIVKTGHNSDAVRFLNKALKYDPENYLIKYRLAIIYADLDPIKSLEYFEPLMKKMPQNIDINAYNSALMKSANIEDIKNNGIQAKRYRYKVHTLDLFNDKHVVYKDDVSVQLKSFELKKIFFSYRLRYKLVFINNSARDIFKMKADFILLKNGKQKEIITKTCANKDNPLFSNSGITQDISVEFGKNIFTKKELKNYSIEIYAYKDPKFKTLLGTYKIPQKNQSVSELGE